MEVIAVTVNDESPRNILLKIAMTYGLTSQALTIGEPSLTQKQIRTALDELEGVMNFYKR